MTGGVNYVSKKMIVTFNALVIELISPSASAGGARNLDRSRSLTYVDEIYHNRRFGTKVYPTIYHQAAAYLYFIIKSHSFQDGNKRTGLVTAVAFLSWNGILCKPFDEDAVFSRIIDITRSERDVEEDINTLATWLREVSIS